MPKRFTDTDKWKKPFMRRLKGAYKLLWFYILDECDHAGIWQVDFEVARIRIGEKVEQKIAENCLAEKIEILPGGEKWFIRDFVFFQYGNLSENNRLHSSVMSLLLKNQIDINKPLRSPLEGAKDKDKEQYKDKEKEKEQEKGSKREIVWPWDSEPFQSAWKIWLEYKQEQFKEKYKPIGMQAALNDLAKISGGIETKAVELIHHAISKGWKGIYPIKQNGNGSQQNSTLAGLEQLDKLLGS